MCITDRNDMTLAVKVALNPNTTNTVNSAWKVSIKLCWTKFAPNVYDCTLPEELLQPNILFFYAPA